MALTVQNLRAVGTGVEPSSLLPGQIAFNITDKTLYVGDGSNFKTAFDGTQAPGVPGNGWYAMPMDFSSLGDYYVANPEFYGDTPTDQQVLTWSDAYNHPIWTSGGGGGGGNQVYVITNAQVAAAPGSTTSAKITAAIGVASPDEGDVAIVTGLPDEVYEGLYFFTTEWVKGAAYAYPSASEVIYDNTAHPTLTPTVQGAIDDLDDGLAATTAIANTANSTATSALSIANAALPKAGGTMTGTIVAEDVDIQSGYSLLFANGSNGSVTGISDSVISIRSDVAASSAAVNVAYNLAGAALPRTGGIMTGPITFVAGQLFPISGIQIATTGQLGVVEIGTNIDVTAGGVISVKTATATDLGLVRIGANVQNATGTISVLDSTTTQKGVVQLYDLLSAGTTSMALTARAGSDLQSQIDAITLATNVTLAGSLDASSGLLDSVTSQGGATVPPFVPGAGLPSPQASLADYYVLVTTPGSYTPPLSPGPNNAEPGDWFLCGETSAGSGIYVWQYLGVGSRPQPATYTTAGIVQLADTAVTYTGTSDTEAVTPNSLQDKLSDSTSLSDSQRIASSTAVKSAYDVGAAALPKAGGTMTGNLTFSGAGVGIVFDDASNVEAISDSVATTSSVTAASSTAVKSAYDLANAALPLSGGTMTGTITFAAGQTFPITGIQDATTGQKGVVQVGTNIDVSSGTISVATATTAVKGLVQVGSNIDVAAGTISVATATTAVKGLVQVGSNIDISAGTISVKSGDTTQPGVVQLNDTTSSTSTTQALTANQGYNLQQQINNLSVSNNLTFAGTIDGSSGLMITVSAEGAAQSFAVGSPMPAAAPANAEYFTVVTVPGTMTPPGGSPQAVNDGDYWLSDGSTYNYLPIGYSAPYASTTSCGVVLLATDLQTQAGLDTAAVVVPSALQSKISDSVATTSSTTIASSAAVKTAYDLANAAVPKACYTALGALAAGTGSSAVGTLPVGTTGQVLAANTGCSTGLEWCTLSLACVPCSAFTAKGDLLTGTGASTFTALPSGTAGQFLTIDTACPENMKWATLASANICGFTCTLTPFNTALGGLAGAALTGLSVANTAIGYAALDSETTGDFNTAVGHNALTAQNGSTGNTVVGGNAGAQVTSGACNTVMGYNAADALTTGNNNVAIGFNSLGAAVSGTNNVAVGMNALALSTTGCQVAVGYCALASNGTGVSNTAVGYFSLSQLLAGSQNTAVGFGTGQILSGQSNTLIGYNAGNSVTTASGNTLVGCSAGLGITTQDGHVAIGSQTLVGTLDINNRNLVAVGTCALRAVTTGLNNIGIGFCAGALITTGGCNIAIGAGALDSVTTTANNIGIGFSALTNITSGSENMGIGTCAGQAITTASNNTSIGYFAGCSTAINGNNTYLGAYAGRAQTSTNNTAVGACALANSGVNNNTGIGFNAGAALTTGGSNTFVGASAGDQATTADNSVAIGFNALGGVATAAGNVAIGVNALVANTGGDNSVAVGFNAGAANTTGAQNVLVGTGAGQTANAGGLVYVGFCAGQANTTSGCGTYVGFVSGRNATGLSNTYVGALTGCAASNASTCGTLLGFCAGSALTTGNGNTLLGMQAGRFVTTGGFNVAIGPASLQTATTATNNVAIGCGALAGLGSTCGNVALGHRAMLNATGSNNVAVGCEAGSQLSTGSTNVLIGNTAGDAVTTGSSNTIIGDIAGSATLANNLILAAGATLKLQVNENGALGVGTTPSYGTPGQFLSSAGTGGAPVWTSSIPLVTAPANSASSGVEGQIASDSAYFYMYTGGRWQRIAWDTTSW